MDKLTVTPLGAVDEQDAGLLRTTHPLTSIINAEVARMEPAWRDAKPHEEMTVREECAATLRRDAATVREAMAILARVGAPAGLGMVAALRCALPALDGAASRVAPGMTVFADDPE